MTKSCLSVPFRSPVKKHGYFIYSSILHIICIYFFLFNYASAKFNNHFPVYFSTVCWFVAPFQGKIPLIISRHFFFFGTVLLHVSCLVVEGRLWFACFFFNRFSTFFLLNDMLFDVMLHGLACVIIFPPSFSFSF